MAIYTLKYTENTPATQQVEAEQLSSFITKKFKKFESGYVVCWLHHKVLIGDIKSGTVHFERDVSPDYARDMVRIRIFKEEKEWHIWQSTSGFQARFREEKTVKENCKENDIPFVDADLVLWGTQSKDLDNEIQQIREDRGTALTLPSSLGKIEKEKQRVVVQTRNYVDYNEIGQAGYVDSRFCKIFIKSF